MTVDPALADICEYMIDNYSDDYQCAVGDGNIFREYIGKIY